MSVKKLKRLFFQIRRSTEWIVLNTVKANNLEAFRLFKDLLIHSIMSKTVSNAKSGFFVLFVKQGWLFIIQTNKCTTYTGCPGRNVPDFGRTFLKLKYIDITQNTYIRSWTVTEIMAREVWKYGSCYTLIIYQIHIKTGRNIWFL